VPMERGKLKGGPSHKKPSGVKENDVEQGTFGMAKYRVLERKRRLLSTNGLTGRKKICGFSKGKKKGRRR